MPWVYKQVPIQTQLWKPGTGNTVLNIWENQWFCYNEVKKIFL